MKNAELIHRLYFYSELRILIHYPDPDPNPAFPKVLDLNPEVQNATFSKCTVGTQQAVWFFLYWDCLKDRQPVRKNEIIRVRPELEKPLPIHLIPIPTGTHRIVTVWGLPPRNQWGPLTRWPSANTASRRGDTPLLSPLPHPVCTVICV